MTQNWSQIYNIIKFFFFFEFWLGQVAQNWESNWNLIGFSLCFTYYYIYRFEISLHLCQSCTGKIQCKLKFIKSMLILKFIKPFWKIWLLRNITIWKNMTPKKKGYWENIIVGKFENVTVGKFKNIDVRNLKNIVVGNE